MNPTIDRKCHWLRRNRTAKRPGTILFLDTEADINRPDAKSEEHSYRLGVGALCQYDTSSGLQEVEWRDLPTPGDLWSWLEEISGQHKSIMVVSHNMDYDSRISRAFWFLPRLGWEPDTCIMAPSCTLLKWVRKDRSLTLMDNLNLFRLPLADLGRLVGIEKIEVDFDTVDDPTLLARCKVDVKILVEVWRWWLSFLDSENAGDFACTIASQAFNMYRHRFMPVRIGVHNNLAAIEIERSSYKGARCEVFRLGKLPEEQYYKLDVNGLYAAMMSWHTYPSKLVKVIQQVSPPYLKTLLEQYLAIAEVVVETADPKYPVQVNGRSVFPVGTFQTTLTTPDLLQALDCNEIRAVGRVALYVPEDLFSKYVDYFQELREQATRKQDFATSSLYKLLRNALQGKMGQHGYSQSVIGDAPLDVVSTRKWYNPETGEECTDWTFGGKVIRQVTKGESDDSFPAIPSHVNAYGRLYLWQLINLAGREHVFYADTDSLLVDQVGYDNLKPLVDPVRLGYLKLEGTATQVEVHAKKDYKFGGKETVKGIRRDAKQVGDNTFDQWHFSSLRYAFESKCLEGVTVSKVRKELKRTLTSGTTDRQGWVIPPVLRMSYEQVANLDPRAGDKVSRVWWFDPQWLDSLKPIPPQVSRLPAFVRQLALVLASAVRPLLRPVCASFALLALAVVI